MNVCVDESGNDPLPSRVDDLRVVWHTHLVTRSHVADASAVDHNGCIPDRWAACPGNYRRALNDRDSTLPLLRCNNRRKKKTKGNAANLPRTHACLPREGFEFLFGP